MMGDIMTFPRTVEEFMEQYKIVDTENAYSNGIELVPIFRMKQWFEHEKAQLSQKDTTSDIISRQAAIDAITKYLGDYEISRTIHALLRILPSAQQEVRPIDYQDCLNAMLKMWIDNVVTDREYNRIMNKLIAHWGKKDG